MQIWAVGGGKGGTGKSLVANGMGSRLAKQGQKVVLVDADYGGANQHTYCGIRKPPFSLARFFEDGAPLEELLVETRTEGLYLIPGNFNSPNTDGLTSTQKLKLFRHIKRLSADHVMVDLGAGTNYDTLDTFLMADIQVGVIAPDVLSIENFYLFVKNLQYRQLGSVLGKAGLKEIAKESWKHRADYGIATVSDFIEYLRQQFAAFSDLMNQEQERFRLHIILNQVREYRQVEMGQAVKSMVSKFFHITTSFGGYIRYDKELWHRFGQDSAVIQHGGSFGLEHDLEGVTETILKEARS